MIIVPGRSYEPVVTRHSRELSRRVEQVVREYRSEYDDISDEELRSALQLATRATAGDGSPIRKRRIIVAALAAAVAALGAALGVGGRTGAPDNIMWMVVAGVAAAAGVGIALVRLTRRN